LDLLSVRPLYVYQERPLKERTKQVKIADLFKKINYKYTKKDLEALLADPDMTSWASTTAAKACAPRWA
ncbi:MAG: hypothetical protein AAFR09_05150, partial [Pseudomonadota bacterium]